MKPTVETAANSEPGDAMLESVRFGLEINRLMESSKESASSFTALLELPPTQAMKLIGSPESTPAILTGDVLPRIDDGKPYFQPFDGNLTFPSNTALIERAAKFSVFAIENNSCASSDQFKKEPMETDMNPISPPEQLVPEPENRRQKAAKRKGREKKGKGSTKKSKNESCAETEKLPYVHVRARRGQATDSHSLAERVRREKINARMKLLQELVPGCSKISGMALVLDEIINHVQSLQHQVEFLSMRLAEVNPRVDFSILAAESGSPIFPGMNGNRQQCHLGSVQQP